MAANKSVIVLTPDGRRQNVQVTPNTTILQVLEEVCQKHGYNANDYDIKHFNKILDVNSILRFTGLSNNARVEMVPCKKPRNTSKVTVGILLENGERLMNDFLPDVTLAQVLTTICPNEDRKTAVIIYMHREVHGQALEEMTLKSLGLTSGKAMLRMIHRDLVQLKTQAHVSTTLIPKSTKPIDDDCIKYNKQQRILSVSYEGKALDPITLLKEERNKMKIQDFKHIEDIRTKEEDKSSNNNRNKDNATCDHEQLSNYNDMKDNLGTNFHSNAEEEINIEFLGERNALVFDQAGAQALPKIDLPDSFFDLTVEDAKILLRDAKRRREELEEAPLLTEAQRQLEQNKRTLEQLNKYRRTVIRIQFPDQLVFQACFKPIESVQVIKDIIRNYLCDPSCDFTLYTAPPKHILNPDARLIDENLVPCAIIYYSGTSSLKSSVKEKLIDPKIANIQAIKSRMTIISEEKVKTNKEENKVIKDITAVPGPSGC
ncbi:tether containing UBX domain for GLUT4-like [Vespa mandarinia]|uniref:tether containing UBX domain for GLUT4-like n=1 Tax=Vespa mandarinia TaxID=7446 RepID=UPI00161E8AD6|nr:tether containing UBX domain for GLUT4-like [Vespa mandarinia]